MNVVTQRANNVVVWAALLVLLGPQTLFALPSSTTPQEAMMLVNDYWIATHRNEGGLGPNNAVYHMGNLAMYRTLCDTGVVPPLTEEKCDAYFERTLNWAKRHEWQLNMSRATYRNADDQAAGQVYIEFCQFGVCDLQVLLDSIDGVMTNEPEYKDYNWKWIDAFFMAAPVFSKLGELFGDSEYFDKMTALYTGTDPDHNGLPQHFYDVEDHLWHRDKKFLPSVKLTQNGKKVFWSRGNGWVLAGLARVLEHLPPNYPGRDLYVSRFRDMAASLKARQHSDGFWNVSLGDPDDFAGLETSGTALFTYAIAWGINNEILTQEAYMPVVLKAWEAIVRGAVQDTGYLGYVQRSADEPCDWMNSQQEGRNQFKEECIWTDREEEYVSQLTDAYGVGAFLLAGSEVVKLASQHVLQAEEADKIGGGSRVESNHGGYHGSGFVNLSAQDGFIKWARVDGGEGGNVTLSFRHALRPSGSRTARLVVNGQKQKITFESTGAWDVWKQKDVDVILEPGANNTIRLVTTGQDCANIDELLIKKRTP